MSLASAADSLCLTSLPVAITGPSVGVFLAGIMSVFDMAADRVANCDMPAHPGYCRGRRGESSSGWGKGL